MSDEIERIAEGLSEREARFILGARKVADKTYEMPPGGSRGLHIRGLVWRSFHAYCLSETGLAVRAHLQEQSK